MNREYHKWLSPALGREMELLVFGEAGPRMLVFPSRLNRFFEYEDRGMVHSLRHLIEAGEMQLICLDGVDHEGLYCFEKEPAERIGRFLEYERYVLDEVLPFSEKLNPRTSVVAHGCSLGAYHAMAIALRHPTRFRGVLALSGRYDLTIEAGEFHSLFHGFNDESLSEIMPSHFVPTMGDRKKLKAVRRLSITVVIGEDDPLYANNVELCAAFGKQKIPCAFHVWCGNAHRFRYWRQMVRIYWRS